MTPSDVPVGVPEGVVRRLTDGLIQDEFDLRSPVNRVLLHRIERMAQLATPQGEVVEWWEGPNEAGGSCVYLREVRSGGEHESGSTWCDSAEGRPEGVPPMHLAVDEIAHSSRWVLAGHVFTPGAATVRVVFTDDRIHECDVQPNGYFLALLPGTSDAQPHIADNVALDSVGNVLERSGTRSE
jgi:hypothetical protein